MRSLTLTKAKRKFAVSTAIVALPFLIGAGYTPKAGSFEKASTTVVEDTVYSYGNTDPRPNYPGGIRNFYEYVNKNVKTPKTDKDTILKVITKFIVEKDGRLTNIETLKSDSKELSKEVIRVLKLTEKWTPGYVKGKTVRTQFIFPVQMSISSK